MIEFNIDSAPADKALTQFAKQANTTLLFPYDLAAKETANELKGRYSVEIGIVKLLEGTGLYPVTDAQGQLSVRPIYDTSRDASRLSAADLSRQAIDSESTTIRKSAYVEALQETYIEKIAIVGSRSAPRNAIESSVPLDVISATEIARQGNTDLIWMLSKVIPSLNVNDQPINDASTLVRPANLRGMASDHTLVLMNGKRRHRSAVITFLGGGLSDGAQGPDIAAIPFSGIKQVGVLRDGASAQYGSDAIAGVLNFVLKDDDEGGSLEAKYGTHYEGDGDSIQLSGNLGLSLTDNGFANISAEYRTQNPTSRSTQRQDAAILAAAGVPEIQDPAQIWGTPDVNYDVKLSGNFGLEFGKEGLAYSFINASEREVEGGFFFRNPQTRTGVNVRDIRRQDTNGDGLINMEDEITHFQWLVADLTPDLSANCPTVEFAVNELLIERPEYQQVLNDPDCFAFNELFPGGFTPRFGGKVTDVFWVTGVKGEIANDWQIDVSANIGYSKIDYEIRNTLNPSLGPLSPTTFSPGGAVQIERSINVDLRRTFELGLAEPLHFATGIEWRRENYRQVEGNLESHQIGPFAFDPVNQVSQGFSVGSNGFPGYRPESAGSWSRGNWAFYADAEAYITDNFSLGAAVRIEDFTDFGATLDGKLSALWQLNDEFAFRGSINSGFKAPTIGQSNVINVTTAFAENGLEDQATLPPTDPISQQLGATPLEPEESVNVSFGLVGQLQEGMYLTVDYFNIRLNDRISTTSAIPLRASDIQSLEVRGIRNADRYGAAKYFTNDFDTTTQGVDLVFNYHTQWLGTHTQASLTYNWTNTNIDRVTRYERIDDNGQVFEETNLTPQRVRMIEENIPKHRASASISQTYDNFNALLRLNYFGGYYEDHLDASSGLDISAGSELTVDVEIGIPFDSQWQLLLGANNLFDNRPDDNPYALRAGALYPSTSPMGINGGLYYLRAIYQF